jgi:isoquinoline 1-oxidoreductase beta subunit
MTSHAAPDHSPARPNRREFLVVTAVVGGGMALGFAWPAAAAQATGQPWSSPTGGAEIGPWVVISRDDTVVVRVAQAELGQGALTGNAMILCEELECDWSKVRVVYAEANRNARENRVYGSMGTGASGSVREGRVMLQQAGASARERLKTAAAERWSVPVGEVVAEKGVLTHTSTGRTLRYGEVAAQAAGITLPDEPAIRPPDQFRLIGTHRPQFGVPEKVYGEAVYGIDIRLPDMLYAAVKMSPVFGGKLATFDFDTIKNRPGIHSALPVEGLRGASGIAVVADTWWRAKRALDALPVTWVNGPNERLSSDAIIAEYLTALDEPGVVAVDDGDPVAAFQRATAEGTPIVEAVYELPYQTGAAMEPVNATAQVRADRVDVWAPSQNPDGSLDEASAASGLSKDKVFVHQTFIGGAFAGGGNRGRGAVAQAVAIAKTLNGRPVKVLWSREEDTRHANYHPNGIARFRAALGGDGLPVAATIHKVGNRSFGSLEPIGRFQNQMDVQNVRGLNDFPYGIQDLRVEVHDMTTGVPTGAWRSVGNHQNVFFVESFIDELAHAARRDPYEYRRALLQRATRFRRREGWLKALDRVAEKSGWGTTLPRGTGRGMAIDDHRRPAGTTTAATCAIVATVTVTNAGRVRVERMDIVFDHGPALVNPTAAERQFRGQMAWALGPTLFHEITIADGRVVQGNYQDYAMVRMAEFPRQIEIEYLKSDEWILGVGESAVPQVAPAVCNAIFAVTGRRIRSLPLRRHDLSWA